MLSRFETMLERDKVKDGRTLKQTDRHCYINISIAVLTRDSNTVCYV